MAAGALGQLISSIFSDETARAEFESDPEKAMSRFALTESEKKAVVTTRMRLGLVTAGGPKLDEVIGPISVWG
jgi:hypothetical protein